MPTMTMEERLAEMGRQIDELAAKAQAASGGAKSRVEHELATLRARKAAAAEAARRTIDGFEEKAEQFESRLRVARDAVATDLADDRRSFADALEHELESWDAYFERLQALTALRTTTARQQAESAIGELRRRRNDVSARLADATAASDAAWQEQKLKLAAARDELERKADELSAKFN